MAGAISATKCKASNFLELNMIFKTLMTISGSKLVDRPIRFVSLIECNVYMTVMDKI